MFFNIKLTTEAVAEPLESKLSSPIVTEVEVILIIGICPLSFVVVFKSAETIKWLIFPLTMIVPFVLKN